jgi:hypothetical protein
MYEEYQLLPEPLIEDLLGINLSDSEEVGLHTEYTLRKDGDLTSIPGYESPLLELGVVLEVCLIDLGRCGFEGRGELSYDSL